MVQSPSIQQPPARSKRHSIFGLISFVIGLVSLTMVIGGLAVLVALEIVHRGQVDLTMADAVLTGLCAITGGPLAILGAGSGVAGFFEEDRRRLFNGLGIALNVLSLLLLAATIGLGIITNGRTSLPPNL